jgi:serine protease Do
MESSSGGSQVEAGFEQAIEMAQARTVKLSGLGAGMQKGYGSGIVVSPDGLVLTVLTLLVDASKISAVTADGTTYQAVVVARDPALQMALLQLERLNEDQPPPSGLAAFSEGMSEHLRPGSWLVAAGNSFKVADGAEPVSVAIGVYSGRARLDAKRREQEYEFREEVLVYDAVTANPGKPGGPVVDLDGRWVGMVGRVVTSNVTHTQFNHAFPVETCLAFLAAANDPAEGAAVANVSPSPEAGPVDVGIKLFEMGYRKKLVYIEKVQPDSPAKRAGLRSDDLIVSAAGRSVPDLAAFQQILDGLQWGDSLELVVLRDDKAETVTLVLAEAPK